MTHIHEAAGGHCKYGATQRPHICTLIITEKESRDAESTLDVKDAASALDVKDAVSTLDESTSAACWVS